MIVVVCLVGSGRYLRWKRDYVLWLLLLLLLLFELELVLVVLVPKFLVFICFGF
jgi:hypothetical protein